MLINCFNAIQNRFEYLEHEYSSRGMSIIHLHITLCGDDVPSEGAVTLGHVTVTHLAGPVHKVISTP